MVTILVFISFSPFVGMCRAFLLRLMQKSRHRLGLPDTVTPSGSAELNCFDLESLTIRLVAGSPGAGVFFQRDANQLASGANARLDEQLLQRGFHAAF